MSAIVALITLLGVYYTNYLSTATDMLGMNTASLAQVFPFPYMPAGVFFMGAWTLIYVLIGIYTIIALVREAQHKKNHHKILWLFALTSVFNILWTLASSREMYLLSIVIIVLLMIVLGMILTKMKRNDLQKTFGRWAMGAYYGWVSMATTVLSLSMLVYLYNPTLALSSSWSYIVMVIGAVVTILSWMRWKNAGALVLALWALAGVAIAYFG